MTSTLPAARSTRGVLAVLVLLYAATGACGLVYQQLWLRLLALVFGVTVYAAGATLASFMGGLALGGLLAGRLADRVRAPLALFGVVEIAIGACALLTPAALHGVQLAWVALHPLLPGGLLPLTLARGLCAGLVLLVPTTLMGASLPIMVRSSLLQGGSAGPRIGALYAANTGGALAGALLCGLVLIGEAGIGASFRIAAALNVAAGLVALLLARLPALREPEAPATLAAAADPVTVPASAAHQAASGTGRLLLAVFAVSGFVALALEVVWFRMLVGVVNATTYAFTFMLAAVLLGLAAGGALSAPWLARRPRSLHELAVLELLLALATLLGFFATVVTYVLYFQMLPSLDPVTGRELLLPALASAIAILPSAMLMGAAWPLGLQLFVEGAGGPAGVGRRTGRFNAWNLLGAIAGALAGGFLLLPQLGVRGSLVLLAGLSLAAGLVLLGAAVRDTRSRGGSAGRAVATGLVSLAAFAWLAFLPADPLEALRTMRYPDETLVWHEEGAQTSVSLTQRADGVHVLYLDGLHQANDGSALVRFHELLGTLGLLLHPHPESALVIGLGGGATAAAVSRDPGVEVDVVELSPSVVRGAAQLAEMNDGVLARPNVHVIVEDGRNHLLVTPRRYDLVVADIIQPRNAGAGNLYSAEFFRLVRGALAPEGLMVQWVEDPGTPSWRLIARTFLEVFPHATLWCGGRLLVGGLRPLRTRPENLERRLAEPAVRSLAAELGLDTPEGVLAQLRGGSASLREAAGSGPVLTDDRPLLEYFLSMPQDSRARH